MAEIYVDENGYIVNVGGGLVESAAAAPSQPVGEGVAVGFSMLDNSEDDAIAHILKTTLDGTKMITCVESSDASQALGFWNPDTDTFTSMAGGHADPWVWVWDVAEDADKIYLFGYVWSLIPLGGGTPIECDGIAVYDKATNDWDAVQPMGVNANLYHGQYIFVNENGIKRVYFPEVNPDNQQPDYLAYWDFNTGTRGYATGTSTVFGDSIVKSGDYIYGYYSNVSIGNTFTGNVYKYDIINDTISLDGNVPPLVSPYTTETGWKRPPNGGRINFAHNGQICFANIVNMSDPSGNYVTNPWTWDSENHIYGGFLGVDSTHPYGWLLDGGSGLSDILTFSVDSQPLISSNNNLNVYKLVEGEWTKALNDDFDPDWFWGIYGATKFGQDYYFAGYIYRYKGQVANVVKVKI
jgi:hypothetical protein